MINAQQLTRLLREELVLQTRHCQLLEAQHRALVSCDRPRFARLQEEYAALVGRLQSQAEARTTALRDVTGDEINVTALLETMPEATRPSLAALRDTLARTLEHARILCQSNEGLIRNELDYIAFSLDLFVEAGRRADVSYGGGGRLGRRKLLDRRA